MAGLDVAVGACPDAIRRCSRILGTLGTLLTLARANLDAALMVLRTLQEQGLETLVLCPGSRSGPLAMAAGLLATHGDLQLLTAVDERSAAFWALGMATAAGRAVAVVTTSGSAVANLLPAAVEADRSCQPLLFLSADRPARLKNCGANQSVNQEDFLRSVCRWFGSGPQDGLHLADEPVVEHLAQQCWLHAHGLDQMAPGPVHCNLPLEEPLHASLAEQQTALQDLSGQRRLFGSGRTAQFSLLAAAPIASLPIASLPLVLDPSGPGVVVAGPWRGLAWRLPAFQQALHQWLELSGWPLLADPLAAVPTSSPNRLNHWELLLPDGLQATRQLQVLRLGPLPASRRLEAWLNQLEGPQLLITEAESRPLDPLRQASQLHCGLVAWVQQWSVRLRRPAEMPWLVSWQHRDDQVDVDLAQALPLEGICTEPALAFHLARLLPVDMPVMLAASSPVRDWLTWAGGPGAQRQCYGFRGASGIDGTLSVAMGLAMARGPLVLVTGDLALLHDSNGWLHAAQREIPLLVVLIDNNGGGIFQQLPIESDALDTFDRLFAMPQAVDPLRLAAAHGIVGRGVACLEDLPVAVEWGLAQQGPALLRICTDRRADAALRLRLRTMVHSEERQA